MSQFDTAGGLQFVPRARVQPIAAERSGQHGWGGVNRAQHRLNGVLAVASVVIVALNRPALWMLWTVLFAVLGLAYGVGVILANGTVPVTLASFGLEALLMLALLAFQLLQLTPIGGWLQLGPGVTITLDPGSTRLRSDLPGLPAPAALRRHHLEPRPFDLPGALVRAGLRLAPLLAIAALLGRCIIALRDPSSTMLSLATLGVGFVFAIHSLVDFSAETYADGLLLVAMLALGAVGGTSGLRRDRA